MKILSLPFLPLVLMLGKREKEDHDHFMVDITFVFMGKRYDFTLEQE